MNETTNGGGSAVTTQPKPNALATSDGPTRASQALIDRAKEQSLAFMNPERWNIMNQMAQTFMQSGALPKSIANAAQLIMVMQAGFEAGLQPLEAISSFYIVNGKISMYGDTAISQVLRAGHTVEWGECNDKTATVTITRGDNGKHMTSTYTIAQANARGLSTKEVWQKFPENMLKFKAFSMTAKFVCPDALRGVPVKEDIEGSPVVDVEVTSIENVTSGIGAAKSAATVNHKPLAEALEKKDEPKPEPKKTAAETKKEKDEVEKEVAKAPKFENVLLNNTMSSAEKVKALTQQELDGKKLTKMEVAFINQHRSK